MPDRAFATRPPSPPLRPIASWEATPVTAQDAPPESDPTPTIERQVAACRRHGTSLAVLSIGFEGLHAVADLHGAEVEAKLVRALWARLLRHVRAVDIAHQAAADEFSLVLPEASRRTAAVVEARVAALLAEPCRVDGIRLGATVCTGVALFPESGATADELLRSAREARAHGLGTCVRRT